MINKNGKTTEENSKKNKKNVPHDIPIVWINIVES